MPAADDRRRFPRSQETPGTPDHHQTPPYNNHQPTHSPPPYHPTMSHSESQLKQHARQMRNNPTHAEQILWQHIRMGQLDGHRFLRQRTIDNMIVDFLCRGRRLIIEIDGGHHDEQKLADQARTKRLNQRGYRVLRFWNNEVTQNLDGVLHTIQQALKT